MFALQAQRRLMTWAILVSGACLLSSAATPPLRELAMLGAATSIPLAIALGSLALFRFARDRRSIVVGMSALGVASLSLVVASVVAGAPVAAAVLSSDVPFLVGALIAVRQLLDAARSDRIRTTSPAHPRASPAGMAAIQRSLAVIILRADELMVRSEDDVTRRAAADLREVARRALTSPTQGDATLIQIHVTAGAAQSRPPTTGDTARGGTRRQRTRMCRHSHRHPIRSTHSASANARSSASCPPVRQTPRSRAASISARRRSSSTCPD